jgi:hypothetical protein
MIDYITSDAICHCCAGGGYPREGVRALSAAPTREVFVCQTCLKQGEVCVQCRSVVPKDQDTILLRKPADGPNRTPRIYALCHGCVMASVRPLTLLLSL